MNAPLANRSDAARPHNLGFDGVPMPNAKALDEK